MRGVIFLLLISSPLIFFFNIIFSLNAGAEDVTLRTEFIYTNSNSTVTNKETGDITESDGSRFTQQYKLDISRTIYPYLSFRGGGIFELDSYTSATQDVETETEEKTIRPYVELNMNSPLYMAGIGFSRIEIEEAATNIPATRDLKDTLNVILGWRPVGLPYLRFFYDQTHIFDDSDTMDSIEKTGILHAEYMELKGLTVGYNYIRNETEDRIMSFEKLRQFHEANIDYSRSLLNERLSMNTSYRISYSTTELPGEGISEMFPLLRTEGLFSPDNTPEDGPAPTADVIELRNGDFNNSSGIDIGWSKAGEADRNIGIDFGLPVSVDKVYLWIDRDIPSTAVSFFSWSVYTSPETGDLTDFSTWTLHATITPATFGTFQNRFEISFPKVETRYIKVVVSPLSLVFSGDSDLQNILVTEMEAFNTTDTTEKGIIASVKHDYALSLNGRLSDKTVFGYNLFYRLEETDLPDERRTTLINGINVNHIFNRVFSIGTRLARDDTELTIDTTTDKSVEYNYGVSVRAAYMENFGQTLTYSGTRTSEESGSSNANSILLRTNAKLYTGWDAFLDTGYGWSEPPEGGQTTSKIIRSGTNIVPNEKLTFNINYSATITEQSEGTEIQKQLWNLQAFYLPFRTLSLFARLEVDDSEDSTRLFQNYSVNWSPFLYGDLQLSLNYNEVLRPADERKERTMGPRMSWKISRHAMMEIFFNISTSESALQTIDSTDFNTKLKMFF